MGCECRLEWPDSVTHDPARETDGACASHFAHAMKRRIYCPVLGLVVGPGVELGVGLVVLGVSVPVPPMLPPDEDPELDPGLMLLSPDDEPEPAPPGGTVVVLLPDGEPPDSDGMVELLPEVPVEPPLDVPLLLGDSLPEPEPPPVMPVHAPSSSAQAMGTIHFVIDRSRKEKKDDTHESRTG